MDVETEELDDWKADLARAAGRLQTSDQVIASAAGELAEIVYSAFRSRQSPDGVPWAGRVRASRDSRTGRSRPRVIRGTLGVETGELGSSMVIDVGHSRIAASYTSAHSGFFDAGTFRQVARPLLPRGASGPAEAWKDRTTEQILDRALGDL